MQALTRSDFFIKWSWVRTNTSLKDVIRWCTVKSICPLSFKTYAFLQLFDKISQSSRLLKANVAYIYSICVYPKDYELFPASDDYNVVFNSFCWYFIESSTYITICNDALSDLQLGFFMDKIIHSVIFI